MQYSSPKLSNKKEANLWHLFPCFSGFALPKSCALWVGTIYFVIPVVLCALQVNSDLFFSVICDFVFMVNHYKPPFGKMLVYLLHTPSIFNKAK